MGDMNCVFLNKTKSENVNNVFELIDQKLIFKIKGEISFSLCHTFFKRLYK